MEKIDNLKEKVRAAAERVSKISGTIAKHEAAAAKKSAALEKQGIVQRSHMDDGYSDLSFDSRMLISEYTSKLDEVKGARRKLRDAEEVLANWQAKLDIEIEKERFLSEQAPAVIVEFLNQWKEKAYDWHVKAYEQYLQLSKLKGVLVREAERAYAEQYPGARTWGKEYDKFMRGQTELVNTRAAMAVLGAVVAKMATYWDEGERLEYLEKVLEEDRKTKMLDLIYRVNDVVGTITDATYLQVNEKGNLDGVIIGEKGKARIETIGVGGYNIVCFHYRTNVWPINEEPLKLSGRPLTPELCEIAHQVENGL